MIVVLIVLAILIGVFIDSRADHRDAGLVPATATRRQRRVWARERADLNPVLRRRRRSL